MNRSWHSEAQLQQGNGATLDAWFAQSARTGFLHTKDNLQCAYATLVHSDPGDQIRPGIVISSGRVECYLKYIEVIYDLYHAGFNVFVMDHRGHGLSQRCSPNPMHGHVDDFQEYVDDLLQFVDDVVIPTCPQPMLLCHSMGGAIGTIAVLQRPLLFQRLVLSAPMFGLKVPVPRWLAQMMMAIGLWVGRLSHRPMYFIGQKDYAPDVFANNRLMRSKLRYDRFRAVQQAYPKIQLGGVTYQWIRAANKALALIAEQAHHIELPVLCISAQSDQVVDNTIQQQVVASIPNARWVSINQAQHEVLFEQDHIRNEALDAIVAFLR